MEKLAWGPWTCQNKMIARKMVSKDLNSQNHCKSRGSRSSMEEADEEKEISARNR